MTESHQLYTNSRDITFSPTYGAFRYSTIQATTIMPRQYSSLNAIASCVDTVVSKVAGTSKPGVEFITDGGDFDMQLKAKDLNIFVNRND